MADNEDPDCFPGAPHPRLTQRLFGQSVAEQAILDAYRGGRMPHAWLFGGPEGIGKATLAYRVARFVLAHPDPASRMVAAATDLFVPPDHPVARRINAQGHSDLIVLRRSYNFDTKKMSTEIRVEAAHRAGASFAGTTAEGGWRVAILDCAEDLNRNSANALLKLVEEPPPRSLFIIVSHRPGALLPTIRSRVRLLPMQTLSRSDVLAATRQALGEGTQESLAARAADLSGGSVRRALKLTDPATLSFVETVRALLDRLPRIDPIEVHKLAERLAGRAGDASYETAIETIFDWISLQIAPERSAKRASLAPFPEVWDKIARAVREADTYNLDRRSLVLSIFADLAEAVRLSRAA